MLEKARLPFCMQQTPPEGHYVLGTVQGTENSVTQEKRGHLDMMAQQKNHPISKSHHKLLVKVLVLQQVFEVLYSTMGLFSFEFQVSWKSPLQIVPSCRPKIIVSMCNEYFTRSLWLGSECFRPECYHL